MRTAIIFVIMMAFAWDQRNVPCAEARMGAVIRAIRNGFRTGVRTVVTRYGRQLGDYFRKQFAKTFAFRTGTQAAFYNPVQAAAQQATRLTLRTRWHRFAVRHPKAAKIGYLLGSVSTSGAASAALYGIGEGIAQAVKEGMLKKGDVDKFKNFINDTKTEDLVRPVLPRRV